MRLSSNVATIAWRHAEALLQWRKKEGEAIEKQEEEEEEEEGKKKSRKNKSRQMKKKGR